MDYNHDFPSAGMIHIRIHSVCVCARACLLFLLHVISMHIYIITYIHYWNILDMGKHPWMVSTYWKNWWFEMWGRKHLDQISRAPTHRVAAHLRQDLGSFSGAPGLLPNPLPKLENSYKKWPLNNSGPRGRNNLDTWPCTQDDGSLDHVTKNNLTYTSLLRTYTFVLATPTKNRADKSNQTKVIKQNKTIQSCSISILGGCSTLPNCPSQDT